jgi:hypothetical protein
MDALLKKHVRFGAWGLVLILHAGITTSAQTNLAAGNAAQGAFDEVLAPVKQLLMSASSDDSRFYATNETTATSKQVLSDVFRALTWPSPGYIESNKVVSSEIKQLQGSAVQDLRSTLRERMLPTDVDTVLSPVRGAFRGLSDSEQKQIRQATAPRNVLVEHSAGGANRDAFIARYYTGGVVAQLYISHTDIVITVCPEQSGSQVRAVTLDNAVVQAGSILAVDVGGTDWKEVTPWPSGSICVWGFAPRPARQIRIWYDGAIIQIKCARSALPAVSPSPKWQDWFSNTTR